MPLDVEGNEQDAMAMADMFETIDTCPVPVIARVHGAALGGGMGLCAVADLVVAESGARFGFTETRLGILPAVIAPFVIAKIGETHARALFPAAGGSTPSAPSGSGSSTRSSKATRRSMRRSTRRSATSWPRARPPPAPPRPIVREVRGLGHGSAKWHTARVIARQRVSAEAREGFAAFDEKRRPAWAPADDRGDAGRPSRLDARRVA